MVTEESITASGRPDSTEVSQRLTISGLQRSQVQIMQRDNQGRVFAEVQDQDPKGMGVAAILTSEMFGLRSILDSSRKPMELQGLC